MTTTNSGLQVGSFVSIAGSDLQAMVDRLRALGYRTIGPQVADGAVIYDDLTSVAQLPIGQVDVQDGGYYRLREDATAGHFDYVVGPHSLKNYIFPPRITLLEGDRDGDNWEFRAPDDDAPPLAVLGVRSCDLHALAVQDRVFLAGPYVDPAYQHRRQNLFLVAVNCRRAAATCFCHSMNTGPAVEAGYDLALTELDDEFVVQIGTTRGAEVIAAIPHAACPLEKQQQAQQQSSDLAAQLAQRSVKSDEHPADQPRQRHLNTENIHDLLLHNLEHPRWQEVAERCLACTNCTLVCPTCFCSTVEEVTDLTGEHVARERTWASCFTAEHSYMNSGTVRKSVASRYRQWLTHKLASWIDQFDVSGCVGCGRCITWCPVGIDLTEEVAAIRKQDGQ